MPEHGIARFAAVGLVIAGLLLAVASLISIGPAQRWDVADAFAADSARPIRRLGMLLGIVGLALAITASPSLVARAAGTPGDRWVLGGWLGFAFGGTLFAMVLGIAAIAMPALGTLARDGGASPQLVATQFTREPAIIAGFLGGNLMYLAWIPLGIGLARTGVVPAWSGWTVAGAAVVGWLHFLHVPVVQRVGGPVWPLAIALVGGTLLRL